MIDQENMRKLKVRTIADWLDNIGIIEVRTARNGKNHRVPTAQGKSMGISQKEAMGQNGKYLVTVYNSEALQFDIDNIPVLIELNDE